MRFPEQDLECLALGKIPNEKYSMRNQTREFLNYFMWSNTVTFEYGGKLYSFSFISSDNGVVTILRERFPDKTIEITEIVESETESVAATGDAQEPVSR